MRNYSIESCLANNLITDELLEKCIVTLNNKILEINAKIADYKDAMVRCDYSKKRNFYIYIGNYEKSKRKYIEFRKYLLTLLEASEIIHITNNSNVYKKEKYYDDEFEYTEYLKSKENIVFQGFDYSSNKKYVIVSYAEKSEEYYLKYRMHSKDFYLKINQESIVYFNLPVIESNNVLCINNKNENISIRCISKFVDIIRSGKMIYMPSFKIGA